MGRWMVMASTCALFAAGCGRAPVPVTEPPRISQPRPLAPTGTAQHRASLLDRVPADTPYLIASQEPLTLRDLRAAFGAHLRALERAPRIRDPSTPRSTARPWAERLVAALAAELGGVLSPRALEGIGFAPTFHYALYGFGVAPVLEVRIADGERLTRAVHAILARVGVEFKWWRSSGRKSYWLADGLVGGNSVVMVITSDTLRIGLTGKATRDRVIARLSGVDAPFPSLSRSTRMGRLTQRLGSSPSHVAFADVRALATAALGRAPGTLGATAKALGLTKVGPHCTTELPRFAAAFPSVALGLDAVSRLGHRFVASLELSAKIRGELAALRAPIPGAWPPTSGTPALGVGVGADLMKLFSYIHKTGQNLRMQPYRCAHLASLTSWGAPLTRMASVPMSPAIPPLRGINLWLTNLDTKGKNLAGSVLVGVDNPSRVLGLLQNLVPGLRGKKIMPHDPPVHVPGSPVGDVWIAATSDVVGVALGTDGEAELTAAMSGTPISGDPLVDLHVGAARVLGSSPLTGKTPISGLIDAGRTLDALHYTVQLTGSGLHLDVESTYRP